MTVSVADPIYNRAVLEVDVPLVEQTVPGVSFKGMIHTFSQKALTGSVLSNAEISLFDMRKPRIETGEVGYTQEKAEGEARLGVVVDLKESIHNRNNATVVVHFADGESRDKVQSLLDSGECEIVPRALTAELKKGKYGVILYPVHIITFDLVYADEGELS